MAGFFDKAKDVAKNAAVVTGEAAKKAAEKTQDTIEISKLNTKIREEKDNIEKLKAEIGTYFLGKFDSGELTDAFVATKAQSIETINGVIAELESKMAGIKDK